MKTSRSFLLAKFYVFPIAIFSKWDDQVVLNPSPKSWLTFFSSLFPQKKHKNYSKKKEEEKES